jgi:hypothetical protein
MQRTHALEGNLFSNKVWALRLPVVRYFFDGSATAGGLSGDKPMPRPDILGASPATAAAEPSLDERAWARTCDSASALARRNETSANTRLASSFRKVWRALSEGWFEKAEIHSRECLATGEVIPFLDTHVPFRSNPDHFR